MFVRSLILKNFRNYRNLRIDFSEKCNIIAGNNGTGKTNLLEAISIVSNIRSFRNVPDIDIMMWGENSYHCRIETGNDRPVCFEVGCISRDGRIYKKAKIDGTSVERISDYISKLPSVVFAPSDVMLISGPPDTRRRYFDGILSRTDLSYYNCLMEFKRILSSRNKTLKLCKARGRINKNEIQAWDSLFAQHASLILKARNKFLAEFEPLFLEAYSGIAADDPPPRLTYQCTFPDPDAGFIEKFLEQSYARDLALGTTTLGPQRDDYIFSMHNENLFNNTASQGQKRTAAIALKCAESIIIDRKTGGKAVIMVDDVFSELDEHRRKNLLALIDRGNQVIFTMVYPERLLFNIGSACRLFNTNGRGEVSLV
ncbi:MAG: DNA replication and repair protein RecF [Spirochaetes bacterium]|nr:MAG: DNA replication and repair protein RecF [Spirochaetota bacterium]